MQKAVFYKCVLLLITAVMFFGLAAMFFCKQTVEENVAAFATCGDTESEILMAEAESEEKAKVENYIYSDAEFIKWIDLNVDVSTLKYVLKLCKEFRKNGKEPDFCEALAYIAVKNGNDFSSAKANENAIKKLRAHIGSGGEISDLYKDNKYYKYYVESYHAVYDGIVGNFKRSESSETEYGIKSFFPFADGFWHSHYDDFGSKRTYGYNRRHLGHDMFGSVGTPVISLEAGTITELGWNRYGGWRVGIRSFDQKRYYYYAHLRKDTPFPKDLKLGDKVQAGQIVGFLGNTGYSVKENVNLKTGKPHLHIGLQIIFDKSQEKGAKEIWVDMYSITKFLYSERVKVVKNENKEWVSKSIKST